MKKKTNSAESRETVKMLLAYIGRYKILLAFSVMHCYNKATGADICPQHADRMGP